MLSYISPSSYKLFYSDLTSFYLYYYGNRRNSQTQAMAIGAAFDAYVKSHLSKILLGDDTFETLFESQVEFQWRDWALQHGKLVFDFYTKSGALDSLIDELKNCFDIRFEDKIQRVVSYDDASVPLLGRPDLYCKTQNNTLFNLDWKVNGYLSKAYPKRGYVQLFPKLNAHKDCIKMIYSGICVNNSERLEDIDTDWATQLSIYSWILGEEVGASTVGAIDQICNKGSELVCAKHRIFIGELFQIKIWERIVKMWEIVNSDHIFRDLTKEESQERCKILLEM